MSSRIRQNFHEECEAFINKQINMEFYASFVYLSMASYFSRDDQALHGFSKYFEKASGEEREHGLKLMRYQVKRGGKVVFQDIAQPSTMEWGTALEAMEATLELEKTVSKASSPTNITLELYPQVNQSLLDLHRVAAGAEDAHLCDF